MEHLRTKFLYAAYGWLLPGGVLHFSIGVIAQYLRGKRSPGPETTLFFGLNTAYAPRQISGGSPVLGRWPGLTFGLAEATGWFAVCVLFFEYTQPRSIVVVFAALLGVAAFTS